MLIQTKIRGLQGELCRFRSNESLLLDDPQVIWMVESGSLALFSVTVENGIPQGSRRYHCNLEPGEAMFSLAPIPEGKQLLAVSVQETELLRVSQAEFEQFMTIANTEAIALIEQWIQRLSLGISDISPPSAPVEAEGIQYFSLSSNQVFAPQADRVLWVRIQQGHTHWMGFQELLFGRGSSILPLGHGTWLLSEDTVELESICTTDLPDTDTLMEGLARLQTYFLYCIDLIEQQRQQEELLRFQERQRLDRHTMDETLNDLASVLQSRPVSVSISLDSSPEQQLLTAAGAVGRALGIPIRPPTTSEDLSRVAEPLEAIARASRIRMRRLHLADKWWQKDCGPMIAYTRQGKRPVALLPVSADRYEIFEPLTQLRFPADESSAATLFPTAYTFYRPLPDKELKTLDLVRFALRGHFHELILILLTGILVTLLGMLTPQATAILIDNAIPSADRGLLAQLALGLFATAFGSTLFQLAQGFTIMRVETFADSSTQAAVWDRLLNLKASFFRQYSVGDLENRVTGITQIRQKMSSTVLKSIFTGLFSLLNLGLLFYYNVSLALIATIAAVVNMTVTTISSILTLRRVTPKLEMEGQLFGVMVQLINGVAKLRVAGAEARAFAYWGKQYTRQLKLMLGTQRIEDSLMVINKVLPPLTSCALFWFAAASLQQPAEAGGGLSTGTFLAFNAAFGTFIGGATSLSGTVVDILQVVPLWRRSQPILKAEPEVSASKADPGRLSGRLAVDHVIFRYRNDGPLTLDDVSIRAEPGEFIALVGTSGSGKSTLFRLLLGFDQPESGTIYYDGQDLSGLDVHAVRRQLGIVMQNSRIMSASIFDNIASGAAVSMEEAWEAARSAGFADDISAMPMGMHTVISEGGSNLSGGQRQRLLIARSLVLKPRILLFDEATSALDNTTQAIVSKSLNRLQVTRVVIAHRLSTIRDADRIYVMQAGRVIQQGSFTELAAQDGLFAQLVARQTM